MLTLVDDEFLATTILATQDEPTGEARLHLAKEFYETVGGTTNVTELNGAACK